MALEPTVANVEASGDHTFSESCALMAEVTVNLEEPDTPATPAVSQRPK